IFSLYWPLALATVALYQPARAWLFTGPFLDKVTGLFLFGVDWRVSSVTYPVSYFGCTVPGLEQAWSLGIELTFYLLAPWLLRSWRAALILMVASFALRGAVAWTGGWHPVWNYTAFPGALVFFLLGHFARVVGDAWSWVRSKRTGLVLTAACFTLSALTPLRALEGAFFWATVFLFAAAIPGLFSATRNVRPLNLLGDLSYPVYLVHGLVIKAFVVFSAGLIALLPKLGGWPITLIYFFTVVAVAVAAHLAVERPMDAAMTSALARFRATRLRSRAVPT
ncbi:MAG TPA: acyltransferase family protein, partial [Alphaproteobacteria bacterium]|nr:acyltransferase family protein [Alphaproteobacteria bacterium]